jgi:hypothetical protein
MLTRGASRVQVHAVVWSHRLTIRIGDGKTIPYTCLGKKLAAAGDDNRFGKILGGL